MGNFGTSRDLVRQSRDLMEADETDMNSKQAELKSYFTCFFLISVALARSFNPGVKSRMCPLYLQRVVKGD